MKKNKILSAVLAMGMMISALPGTMAQAAGTSMTIDVDTVIKNQTSHMYGVSTDYYCTGATDSYFYLDEDNNIMQNVQLKKAFNEGGIPLIRFGAGASNHADWQGAVGPYENRTTQTLWGITDKILAGPADVLNLFKTINPDTAFTVTFNMNDSAEKCADLAEFLIGGADTEWGAKRVEYGYAEPFNVKAFELGNEVLSLGSETSWTVEDYIAKSKEVIEAVLDVDENAKFIAIADTTAYNGTKNNTGWEYAHRAILADTYMVNNIDYIALHTYYDVWNNNVMDEVIGIVEDDIAQSAGKDRIKVYLSEYAVSVFEYGDNKTNPHNLEGILETANILSRTMWHEGLEMATYHGIHSSDWRNVAINQITGEIHLNGIGHMLKMFREYGVGDVLSTDFTGFSEDVRSTSSGVAVKDKDGNINLIFTNDSASALPVQLSFSDNAEYKLVKETQIKSSQPTPNPLTDDIDTLNGVQEEVDEATGETVLVKKVDEKNSLAINNYEYVNPEVVTSYEIPAYSVCAVKLEKKAEVTKTDLYTNTFSGSEAYTVYGSEEGTAEISGGKLVLDGGTDKELQKGYVYLPYQNTNKAFRLDFDVEVSSLADDDTSLVNGIILNSSVNNAAYTSGNLIKLANDAATEITDLEGATIGSGAAPTFEEDHAAHYTVDVKEDGTVSLYIDGKPVYTRTGGLKNSTGYIGFMFSDSVYSIDNVEISNYSAVDVPTTEIEEVFTYEEDFNNIADGKLPEGWFVLSSDATAGVENGELVFESRAWWKNATIKMGNLGNVQRDGLVMEADMTLVSIHEGARAGGARNYAGLAYMIDGAKESSAGLLTYYPQNETREYGQEKNPTGGVTYGAGEGFLSAENPETVNVRLVFKEGVGPTIYINGENKTNQWPNTGLTNNYGALGLTAQASKVKFDNIKISGIRKNTYNAEDVVERDINFTYEENFDNLSNGTLPAGWNTYSHAITDMSKVSAGVDNGSLKLAVSDWNAGGVKLGNLGKVKRAGLTMEADITFVSDNSGSTGKEWAGMSYMITDTTESSVRMSTKDDYASIAEGKYTIWNPAADQFITTSSLEMYKKFVTNKETVKFKAVFGEDGSPVFYLNGNDIGVAAGTYDSGVDEGFVGFNAASATILIDNVKITGTRTVKALDNCTYRAEFKTATEKYASPEAAIADVKVTEITPDGKETDISSNVTVTSAVEGKACTLTVKYGDKIIATLTCTLMDDVEWAFVYEEDFSSGVVPAEWIATDTTVSMSVSDEALILKNEEEWHGDYVLFTDLGNVLRQGLTMEFDITRIGDPKSGNSNNSGAGFAYMANLTDGTSTGSYCTLYTDKPLAYQQGDVMDPYRASFNYQNPTGGIMNEGGTHHLKLVFNNTTQSPVIYLDGVQPDGYSRTWSDKMVTSGLVGLFCYNTTVKIDNIKITGKKRVPVTEAVTISAGFTTESTEFESVDAAIAAVKVTKNSYLEGEKDITAESVITSKIEGNICTITVKYNGKIVDTLACTIKSLAKKSFVYEENFDTIENGSLPEGWTFYKAKSTATAQVQDGALIVDSSVEAWSPSYVLFDLEKVLRSGLTVEFDITRAGAGNSSNSNNAAAGIAYMADVTDGTVSSAYAAAYTDKDTTKVTNQQTIQKDFGMAKVETGGCTLDEGISLTDGTTEHIKIISDSDTTAAVLYINGKRAVSWSIDLTGDVRTSGMVGIYAYASKVKIDNVKVTGSMTAEVSDTASINVKSTAVKDSKLLISVEAENLNKNITNALMAAAVYEKGTNNLVAISALKDWDTEATDIVNTSLEVSGVSDYSAELYDVKVMAMDKTTLIPVAESAKF